MRLDGSFKIVSQFGVGVDDLPYRPNWAGVDVALVVRSKTRPIGKCDLRDLSLAAARRPLLP